MFCITVCRKIVNLKKVSLFIMLALMTITYNTPEYDNGAIVGKASASESKVKKVTIPPITKSVPSQLLALNPFANKQGWIRSIEKSKTIKTLKKPLIDLKETPYYKRHQIQRRLVASNRFEKIQKEPKTRLEIVKNVSKPKLPSLAVKPHLPSKKKNINISNELQTLQIIIDKLPLEIKKADVKNTPFKTRTTISKNLAKYQSKKQVPQAKIVEVKEQKKFIENTVHKNNKLLTQVDYWDTVHSIESKQGKLLYRPRNKARNCSHTSGPCGHHQLTVQALKDIGCNNLQCRKDRLNYKKSLQLSKKLLALNEKRLKKHGLTNLEGHQRYLIHQQGANGIKNIIAATKGQKELSKTIKKNMANNSPFSYKQFKRMGSKNAANKFLNHWEKKWAQEQRLVLASTSKTTDHLIKTRVLPSFNESDIRFALNMTF